MRNQIIIIDDDKAVRDSMYALLDSAGFSVSPFTSAMQFLRTGGLALACCIIVDVHMPEMTGIEFLELMHKTHPSMPVVLISGNISPSLQARATRAGAKAVFEKPFDQDGLLDVLRAFCLNTP